MAIYDREPWDRLGKVLAEKAGLDPANTLQEWQAESIGGNRVLVKLTTALTVSEVEWFEMQIAAQEVPK